MEEYNGNSHKMRDVTGDPVPEKKAEKVITGEVRVVRKSGVRKFMEALISEDTDKVLSYIIADVLIPATKKAISDIVSNGVDMLLYGDAGRNHQRNNASRVSYRSYYDDKNDRRNQSTGNRNRATYSYDEIVLSSRGEAEDVLNRMEELIGMYGVVSVGDLYDMVGIAGSYTHNKYGWTRATFRNVNTVRVPDGYILKLPRPAPLD